MKVRALTNKLRWFAPSKYYGQEYEGGPNVLIWPQPELQQCWIDHNGEEDWQSIPIIHENESRTEDREE